MLSHIIRKQKLLIIALGGLLVGLGIYATTAKSATDSNAIDLEYTFTQTDNVLDDSVPDSVKLVADASGNYRVRYNGQYETVAAASFVFTASDNTTTSSAVGVATISSGSPCGVNTSTTFASHSVADAFNIPSDNDEICFKLAWGTPTKVAYAVSHTPASLTTTQKGMSIEIKKLSGYNQYRILTSPMSAATCEASDGFTDTTKYQDLKQSGSNYVYNIPEKTTTPTTTEWYCVRTYNTSKGLYAYVAHEVSYAKPAITVKTWNHTSYDGNPSSQRPLVASATVTENAGTTVDAGSWQYVGPVKEDLSNCDQDNFVDSNGRTLSGVKSGSSLANLNESHNGQSVCFRVANSVANYTYFNQPISGIDFTGPELTEAKQVYDNTENNQTKTQKITVNFPAGDFTTSFGTVGYKYEVLTSGSCNLTKVSTTALDGSSEVGAITSNVLTINLNPATGVAGVSAAHNNLICIWAQDSLENVSGAQIRVDLQAPTMSGASLKTNQGKTVAYLAGFKTSSTDTIEYHQSGDNINPDCADTTNAVAYLITEGATKAANYNTASPPALISPAVATYYLCVRVVDQFGNVSNTREFGPITILTAYADITVAQSDAQTVSANHRNSSDTSGVWKVHRDVSSINYCRSSASSVWSSAITSYTAAQALVLSSSDHNKVYCFVNKNGNNYSSEGIVIDLQGPNITLEYVITEAEDGTQTVKVKATTTSTDISMTTDNPPVVDGWLYETLSAGTTACVDGTIADDSTQTGTPPGTTDSLARAGSDSLDGRTICFQATDALGNETYKSMVLKIASPVVTVTQDNDMVAVTTSNKTDKLEYALEVATDFTDETATNGANCGVDQSTTKFSYAKLTGDKITLSERHGLNTHGQDGNQGYILCVRSTTAEGFYGWKGLNVDAIDVTAPIVTISLRTVSDGSSSTNTITATDDVTTATDTTWKQRRLSSGESCNENIPTTGTTTYAEGSTLYVDQFNGKTFCFWSTDAAGNIGFASIHINLGATPNITVTQDGTDKVVGSTPDSNVIWEYRVLDDRRGETCTNSSGFAQIGDTAAKKAEISISGTALHGDEYCIRAKFNRSGADYVYKQITVDLQGPTISDGVLDNGTITVTVTDTKSPVTVSNFTATTDPTCDETNTAATYTTGTSVTGLTASNNGDYICFKATDGFGNTAYKEIVVQGIVDDSDDSDDDDDDDKDNQQQIDELKRLVQQLIANIIQLLQRTFIS